MLLFQNTHGATPSLCSCFELAGKCLKYPSISTVCSCCQVGQLLNEQEKKILPALFNLKHWEKVNSIALIFLLFFLSLFVASTWHSLCFASCWHAQEHLLFFVGQVLGLTKANTRLEEKWLEIFCRSIDSFSSSKFKNSARCC